MVFYEAFAASTPFSTRRASLPRTLDTKRVSLFALRNFSSRLAPGAMDLSTAAVMILHSACAVSSVMSTLKLAISLEPCPGCRIGSGGSIGRICDAGQPKLCPDAPILPSMDMLTPDEWTAISAAYAAGTERIVRHVVDRVCRDRGLDGLTDRRITGACTGNGTASSMSTVETSNG